jgi:hypothetical protein
VSQESDLKSGDPSFGVGECVILLSCLCLILSAPGDAHLASFSVIPLLLV